MKLQLIGLAALALALATTASGQATWQKAQSPAAPRPIGSTGSTGSTTTSSPPAFKPYQGSSVYSSRGGVNAYPAPAKPKPTFTSIYGPDKPKK